MATSFDVNVKLGSAIGFNIAGGITGGYAPQMQTIRTLDGTTSTQNLSYTQYQGPLLKVDPLTDFILSVGNTSTKQTVKLHNIGNAVLTVTDVLFSFSQDIKPILYFSSTSTLVNGSIISIPPGNTSSFQISYIKKEGILYENPKSTFVLFLSDEAPSIISLDLDFDQYKYKTFTSENKGVIIPQKKGKIASINPNHFYGFHNFNTNQNTNLTQDSNILMINIWTTKPPHLEYYTDKFMDENTTK